ncbi:hypothetical protein [Actinophytocola sp.]|uniref:hypothetical protein n=1 Tax=Actinophytocola sp. TaxID=1872138 RepID=UPI003D6ADD61
MAGRLIRTASRSTVRHVRHVTPVRSRHGADEAVAEWARPLRSVRWAGLDAARWAGGHYSKHSESAAPGHAAGPVSNSARLWLFEQGTAARAA